MDKVRYIAKAQTPPDDRRGLVIAHTILVAAEQVGAACLVMDALLGNDKSPADKSVIWIQFFAAAGGVAELRARLTRNRAQEQAARKHLSDMRPALLPAFDRLTARQIGDDLPLKLCCFARTNYTAFWNEEVSARFVEILSLDGSDPAVMETTQDQKSYGIPWVKEALMQGWRQEYNLSEAKLKAVLPEVMTVCRDAAKVGRYAGMAILRSCGVEIEKVGSEAVAAV
jgi:hypothetical protein